MTTTVDRQPLLKQIRDTAHHMIARQPTYDLAQEIADAICEAVRDELEDYGSKMVGKGHWKKPGTAKKAAPKKAPAKKEAGDA